MSFRRVVTRRTVRLLFDHVAEFGGDLVAHHVFDTAGFLVEPFLDAEVLDEEVFYEAVLA